MSNIKYYVLVNKDTIADNKQRKEIDKIEEVIPDTKLPFCEKLVDIYLISNNKKECEKYIKNLNKDIRVLFNIEQVGSEIQYTAFLDILGFSNYIKTEITNDDLAEEFYNHFNEVIDYIKREKEDEFEIDNADYLKYIKIKYSWVSDTFVISIEYMNEVEKDDENKIKGMMIFRLSTIISSIHHFMALEFGFIVRGAISSKYSCITNNFILGEGVVEAQKLEKEIAIYPRVVFEQSTISPVIYELISKHYDDNDLNYITKDCDGYYFVNYLAMLQHIPPMIGKMPRISDNKIKEFVIRQKENVIKKYQKIAEDGSTAANEKIKAKYLWLNSYLGRIVFKDKFQKNIIHN